MPRRTALLPVASLLPLLPLLIVACAPSPHHSASPEPGTAVLSDGTVWHQSTADENSEFAVAAPPAKVWAALTDSYSSLGIPPTVSDPAGGTYGNGGFIFPRRFADHPISDFFDCGQGSTGARINEGPLLASVVSTIASADTGTVRVTTRITGTVRRNEGARSNPINCVTTGRLETTLRRGVEQRLSGRS
jgi:hypothetical protein